MSATLVTNAVSPEHAAYSEWPCAPNEVFAYLLGEWSFTREVSQQARMQGTARIARQGRNAALYHETGRVHLPSGVVLNAEQRYGFRRLADGARVLLFSGKLFHDLRFQKNEAKGWLSASAEHLCGQDVYRSLYEIRSEACFRVCHHVFGPRKDYEIDTVLHRL